MIYTYPCFLPIPQCSIQFTHLCTSLRTAALIPFRQCSTQLLCASDVYCILDGQLVVNVKPSSISVIAKHTCKRVSCWSCRSVYRRQDVCVAKVILWILTSCTYWWENTPPIVGWWPPIVGWWPPHSWLMAPPSWLMTPHSQLMAPPHSWLMTPHTWLMTPPIVSWWPPHSWLMTPPYLADDPPHGWMMCWVKLVLVLYVWRQDRMRPAQQGLPFIY